MALSREGLICGPSSGMALKGLLEFLQDQKNNGSLHQHADPETGDISCVFLCCDLPYQYMDTYFTKLAADDFHPISNPRLRDIDQGQYDPRWELTLTEAAILNNGTPFELCHKSTMAFHECRRGTTSLAVLDLRCSDHIPGSLNKGLPSLMPDTESPFDSVPVLEAQFDSLVDLMSGLCSTGEIHTAGHVLILCYNGEISRLACSIMRHGGIEAFSVRGGFQTIANQYTCGSGNLSQG